MRGQSVSDAVRLKRLARELKERQRRSESIDFEALCFPGQREFVQDPSKRVLACCSRRAGKSFGIGLKMLKTGFEFPNSILVYLVLARSQAKDVLWPALEYLNEEHGLGLKFKQNTGDVVLPNGSKIILRGMGSQREVEKLRGLAVRAACIDEAQGMPQSLLTYTLREILEPAMLQAGDDCWIAVTGTPNAACSGGFYNLWAGITEEGIEKQTFSPHHWTFFDNKAIPDPEKAAKEVQEAQGWTEDSPGFLREYKGQWVRDTEGCAYKVNPDKNYVHYFPAEKADDWRWTIGVDLGIMDPSAYCVFAWSRQLGECYIVESFEVQTESPSDSAKPILDLQERYDISQIIVDTGGQGKAHVGEWAQRFGLAVTSATKHDKGGRVQMVNNDFISGRLKIVAPRNQQLMGELAILQWDTSALSRNKYVYAYGYNDHLADALQYGFAGCYHYQERKKHVDLDSFEERMRKLEDRMEAQAVKREKARRSGFGIKSLRKAFYRGDTDL